MDEMYENNTDNMEHYQYDPNLLQCESCLQKDELIDNMTQELLSCQRGVVRFRTERNAYIELASKNWTERVKFKEDSLKYMKLYKVTQKILQQYYKHGYEHGIYEYLLLGMCEEFKEQRANLTEELDKLKKNFEDSTSESSAKGEKCRQLEALVFEHEKVLNIHKKCKKNIKDKIGEVRRKVRLEVKKALRKIAKLKNYNMLDITNAIKAIENETVKTCDKKSAETSDLDEEATSNSHLSVKNSDHSEDDIGDLESVCDSIEEHMPPVQGNRLLQSPNIQINNAKASYSIVTHLHSTADSSNVENNDHFNNISDLESVSDYPEKGEGVQLEGNKDSIVKITHCSENYGCHAVLTSSDDIEATIPEREATSNSFSDKHIEQGGENQSLCWTNMDLGEDISGNMPEHVTDDNNLSEEEVYSMIHKQKSEWLVFSRPAVTPTSPSIPTTSSDGIVSSEHAMAGLNEQNKSIQTDNISAFAAISVMKHKEAENIGRGAEFNDSDFDENTESNCQEPSFYTKPAEFECSPNTDSLFYFDISDFNIEESHSSLGMVCDVSTDKTEPQERSYLSDRYLELSSALTETMESTSYTCNDYPDEYFFVITDESEQQEESFESELQEGSYQNSNPEESYQNSNPEESYQNSNPEESYQNSNLEESPPTEITEGCYSEESVSDKMIKQTQLCSTISTHNNVSFALKKQLVKMDDSEENSGPLKDIIAHLGHITFSETHLKKIVHVWKTQNRARNCLTCCITTAAKTSGEKCVVGNIQLSETHLMVNECIRKHLKRTSEMRFSEKLPKKRFRSEDFIPIVNYLAENAKPISPEAGEDIYNVAAIPGLSSVGEEIYNVAAIPDLSSVGEEICHDAPNRILSVVEQEGCDKNVSPNCIKSSHTQNHIKRLYDTVNFKYLLQNEAGPACDGSSCDKDELTSSNLGKYQETEIKYSTVGKIPKLTDKIAFLSGSVSHFGAVCDTKFSENEKSSESLNNSSIINNEDDLFSESVLNIPLKVQNVITEDSQNKDLQLFESNAAKETGYNCSDVINKVSYPFQFYSSAANNGEYDTTVCGIENTSESSRESSGKDGYLHESRSVSTSDTLNSTPTMKIVEDVDYSVLCVASSSCLNRKTLEISEENKSVLRDSMESWESSKKPKDFSYDTYSIRRFNDINTMITYLKEIENQNPQLNLILPKLLEIDWRILIAFTVSRLEMTFNSKTWTRLVELYTKQFHDQIGNILYVIQVRLLHLAKKLPADCIVANFTIFYVRLCHKIKRYSLIESLAVDAFYCLKLKALIVFKEILNIYPRVLPTAESYQSDRKLLFYTLLDMIFHAGSRKSSYPAELQKMLRVKYRYKWEKQVNDQVATTLLNMLKNNYLIQLETAVIIFTKRTSWHRSYWYLLQRGFFPVIDEWLKGNSELSEEAIALSVRCLACVARGFPVPHATDKSAVKEINAVSNMLMSLVHYRNMPETVKKSLQFAIFCHGHEDFDNMLIAFSKLDWKSMRKLVKIFLYYRGREFWYENFPFLKNNTR